MHLSEKLLGVMVQFMDVVNSETGLPVLIYDEKGVVIHATDTERIGTLHPGAKKIMDGLVDEYAVTPDEEALNPLIREGYSCSVKIDGRKVAAFGITGRLDIARPIARISVKMIVSWIKQMTYQEELRRSEEKFRNIFNNFQDVYFETTLSGKVITSSPSGADFSGYSLEEIIGNPVDMLYADPGQRRILLEKLKDSGHVRELEMLFKRKDGSTYDVSVNADIFYNIKGGPEGLRGTIRDITERKHSEKINRTLFAISNAVNTTLNLDDLYLQVHRLLSDIIDTSNFFIAIVDPARKTISFPYYIDSVDKDFSPIKNYYPDNSLTGMVVSKKKALLLKEAELADLAKKKSVCGVVPLIWLGVPLSVKEDVIGVMAVQSYTDPDLYDEMDLQVLNSVSDQVATAIDRKKAEDELRESENKYKHLFNSAPAGMYEIDFVKGCFTAVNDVFCQYSGYTEKELLARDLLSLLTEESRIIYTREYEKVLRGETPETEIEFEIIGKSGDKRFMVLNSDFIYDGRMLTGARVVVHDVTERKKIEDMMIQTEKMMSVGGLAAGMAHELNNPLAGMMQNAQVIRNRLTKKLPANVSAATAAGITTEAITDYMEKRGILKQLDSIQSAGSRAAQIIDNMLSFSRRGNARKTYHRLDEIIDRTIFLAENDYSLKKDYDFRKIEIIREFDPGLPPVLCETSKIQQVIFNILKNASQALSQKRHETGFLPLIILRLQKEDNMARIEIEDNGPGIDFMAQKRIFEPFYSTKSVDKGTGLGLSVSFFIIVEDHKGKMRVKSNPGKGTTFVVKLPL